ncbi:MAG: 2-succinyl-5-enolpyruvyl-6-hydroxy-3-cyclohexene-carboxylic-acid synthase [Bacteroidota bacterium]|jgi:2-succinyl-5-enolpyruvyl-6-hydroxy-3-cyclohexene-1-carboxylate synthase
MFSVKKNVLQLVALLKSYGIKQIVVSPGSRNAPLLHTLSQDQFFECHVIVDERNAAFYALGIAQRLQQPVAVCCTSGTALLNYAPAVAEAFYQQVPLVVLSADLPAEWIGQMDGQTLPQANALGSLVKKAVHLPEVKTSSDEWYCNRLCNEALIACTNDGGGPVHINVVLSEPLFDYSEKELPQVRRINVIHNKKQIDVLPFAAKWKELPKRIIIVGQQIDTTKLVPVLEQLAQSNSCIIFAEHVSNCWSSSFISNFDAILASITEDQQPTYTPDLVVTIGGHIVSKRLKQFLRQHKPLNHWHVSPSSEVVDLFQSLTDLIESSGEDFLTSLCLEVQREEQNPFVAIWKQHAIKIAEPSLDIPFSDMVVAGRFIKALSQHTHVHIANSSAVRNAQLFLPKAPIRIYCNRGTNGIEGSVACTLGLASVSKSTVYLLVGDLSFSYGLSALWNLQNTNNIRILLINNRGGGIFHLLPSLNSSASLRKYVAAEHTTSTKHWALAAGLNYLSALDNETFDKQLDQFFDPQTQGSVLLEVFTDIDVSRRVSEKYYHQLKLENNRTI